jgi:asparagine synthase (glutamine-hydrolysing)
MCGLAGYWGEIGPESEARCRLERLTTTLAHRGPDGQGYWLGGEVGLGHTRLAIIDVEGGKQPLMDASGKSVIVFNGEIYNFRELQRELADRGYIFRTRSDTETIPAAIDAWGIEAGLLRLRGMFAFALYNVQTHRLLLARDRLGIKPLYFACTPGAFLFASEQKALLNSGLLARRANSVAIHDFLALGYPITPATCWADIQMLEPGTWLELSPQGRRSGKYWTWQPQEDSSLGEGEAVGQLRRTLAEVLRSHLIADVPIGAFLSGGLDSSLNVALLSRELPSLKTYCMGFGNANFDESDHARRVAKYCGTEHHEARIDDCEGDPELFCRILKQFDEPFGDSSCIPTFLICGELRQHVKVALSGDGGDEVLGGYIRYWQVQRLAELRRLYRACPLLNPLANFARSRLGRRGYQIGKAWYLAQLPREEMLLGLQIFYPEDERRAMYQPEFASRALSEGPTVARFARFIPHDLSDAGQQLIAAEISLRLHGDYLRKVDIASSAHGLEVRVPFLDNAMLDFAAKLPFRLKVSPTGETKVLARRLGRRLLPPEITARRKQGFGFPLASWMGSKMNTFLQDLLLGPDARLTSLLRPEAVEQTWRAFVDRRVAGGLSAFQRSERIFLLAALEVWLRCWKPSLS